MPLSRDVEQFPKFIEDVTEALAKRKGLVLPSCFSFNDDSLIEIKVCFELEMTPEQTVEHLESIQ